MSDETLLALIATFGLPHDPAAARRELAERQRHAPLGLVRSISLTSRRRIPSLCFTFQTAVEKSPGCAASKAGRSVPAD